ncbi:hypothetical protein JCM7686_0797 [Paracoccus aminophilus JCM 7686]|uniref:Uncharacterized protein n=1 Tax=Paracoccus aminophilus JCM 7686 TaxID=1367847 RepID=S5YRM3_PARAH|nr:hypothetical protein JCM7686_0797 [Paracoccus aminophilus JCM 7686]
MRNRSAWTTAALTGAAFVGKLHKFDEYFGASRAAGQGGEVQTAAQQETALRILAQAWGAKEDGS